MNSNKCRWVLAIGILVLALVPVTGHCQLGRTDAFMVMGQDAETVGITVSDTGTKLTDLYVTASGHAVNWQRIRAVLVTCETYDVRVSFGTAANQSTPIGHVLSTGSSMRIPNTDLLRNIWVVNKVNGSNGFLMVTLEK